MILFNIVNLKTSLKSRRFNMSIHCTTCTKVVVNITIAYGSIIKVLFTLRCFNETNRAGVAQCEARLTRNMEVVGSIPIKVARCFLEQETLSLLFSTGWFQERIRASVISQSN